jgi:hypothetical protein
MYFVSSLDALFCCGLNLDRVVAFKKMHDIQFVEFSEQIGRQKIQAKFLKTNELGSFAAGGNILASF